MKDLIIKLLREDLEYSHVTDATKDEYIIGEDDVIRMITNARSRGVNRMTESLRLDGPLNKPQPGGNPQRNGIYDPEIDNNIVDFGIGQIGTVNVIGQTINNAIYLQGGYNASEQKVGYGTKGIKFLFNKFPKIQNIILGCYETACPFWYKIGGEKIGEKEMSNGIMDIINITRTNFDNVVGL